jgi:hypothetical protein
MRRFLTLLPITVVVAIGLVACGADDDTFGFSGGGDATTAIAAQDEASFSQPAFEVEAEESLDEPAAFDRAFAQADFDDAARAPTPSALPETGPGQGDGSGEQAVEIAERRVISTVFVSIEVEAIEPAAEQVQQVAESMGGFVESSSVSGEEDGGFAEITIRVPQDAFTDALARLRRLGEVRNENLSVQDVTEQFIDLEARLRSAEREETSLLNLLEQATDLSDVLLIERELTRIRTEVERLHGQLNFLERRVSLATLSVSLFTPFSVRTEPPSASYGLDVGDVSRAIEEVEAIAESVDGLVDSSVISISDGEASGFVAIRVPREDFDQAVASVEDLGDVRTKRIRTEEGPDDESVAVSEEPDASIEVRLSEDDGSADAWLIAAIVVPAVIGGLVLLALAFRVGRSGRGTPAPMSID